ncbi:MAG: prolyl oligopeptidase family serine peptidase [Bacteroidota bacterium]
MKKNLCHHMHIIACSVIVLLSACYQNGKDKHVLSYPETKKADHVDNYFGTEVADPYRWLEDDNSQETAQWVKAQNEVTFGYLSQIPFREKIRERLTRIWNYPKYSTPFKKGEYYFFYKNDGIQNQSVLYVHKGIDGEPRVLIDPNKLSEDGTTALTDFSVSNDAKYAAYGIAEGGSDWNRFLIIDIESGKALGDTLDWIKFSGIAWKDSGFYYSMYDAPGKGKELSKKNEFHKVYYHQVGTDQSEDKLIYQDKKHPLRNFGVDVTEDERFAILYESESTSGNSMYCKDLIKEDTGFKLIAEGFEYDYNVIDNIKNLLLVKTNNNAPKCRLVFIDPENPEEDNWEDIIPEKQDVLESVTLAGGKIVTGYMKDANSKVYVYDLNGDLENEIELPSIGTLSAFSGTKDDSIAFYSFSTFTSPSTIYKYNINTNISTVHYKVDLGFNTSIYETSQVFYNSKDGTRIPMFIVHKKGIELNGQNPAFLYGYGGFNISLTPGFSISSVVFLENGGIYAEANIRGGGEYGEEWHKAGTKLNKQNVFDDFIAAAEYLIREKYTSPEKLAISGGSNGGLLVGACMTQRPGLFKVALPSVGVMDMLRFHKFTIGWAWTGDYGSSDDSVHFKNLYSYSPLHNIKKGVEYPATLVTTADHDDRVVPAHSFKFISTLQKKHRGENPVLIRIEVMAGHGAGKPTSMRIEESADIWSFVFYNLGMDYPGDE